MCSNYHRKLACSGKFVRLAFQVFYFFIFYFLLVFYNSFGARYLIRLFSAKRRKLLFRSTKETAPLIKRHQAHKDRGSMLFSSVSDISYPSPPTSASPSLQSLRSISTSGGDKSPRPISAADLGNI
jgi:hypothetical protein